MQHALVTGGSGFIGRHLVAELIRRGVRVSCFARASSRTDLLTSLGAEIVTGDLSSRDDLGAAVNGVDVVYHVAGRTHAISEDELSQTNGLACGALAEACGRAANPPRLVHVSSLSAAGPSTKGHPPLCEEDLPNPVSAYGRSKRLGEVEIQKWASEVPCSILRPGIVFGPHDPGTLSIIEPIYRLRLHIVIGVFHSPALSLIYVDDFVRLMIDTAEQGERLVGNSEGEYSPEGYYFACDDSEHPTYADLGRRLAAAMGRSVFVWPLAKVVGRTIGWTSESANRLRERSSLLNVDKVMEGTAEGWACSSSKARGQLSFVPAQDLDTGFRKTVEWFLQQKIAAANDALPYLKPTTGDVSDPGGVITEFER